jgi:hypothetical protein
VKLEETPKNRQQKILRVLQLIKTLKISSETILPGIKTCINNALVDSNGKGRG